MSIKFDPGGGDISVNVTVGNGFGCELKVFLYGENGHKIKGPEDAGAIADVWVDDDKEPEYTIPIALLAGQATATLVQFFAPAQIVTGSFTAISEFDQGSVKQADLAHSDQLSLGKSVRRDTAMVAK